MSVVLPLLVYGLMGVALILVPYASIRAPAGNRAEAGPIHEKRAMYLLAAFAIGLTALRGVVPAAGVLLVTIASWGRGPRAMVGSAAAALIVSALAWWLLTISVEPLQRWLTAGVCLTMALMARNCSFETLLPAGPTKARGRELLIPLGLFVLALCAALLTGSLNESGSAYLAWHHWGAYISPVISLISGAVPYRDFPVQYGMGPTLLLTAACQGNYWSALFWAAAVANASLLAAFGWIAVVLTRNMGAFTRALALAGLVAATLMWTGYPISWLNPVATPSVGGLRFLPLALIAAAVATFEDGEQTGYKVPLAAMAAGHALWLVSLAWSPETGFFATSVWWPWLAIRRADQQSEQSGKWRTLVVYGVLAVLAYLASHAALALLFRAAFGYWVSPAEFLYYQLNPPGRLPIDGLGSIWFAVTVFVFACLGIARSTDRSRRRTLYALALSGWAAFSYFISRSHDNNIINLLAWFLLTMLAAQRALPSDLSAGFLRGTLAGIIGLVASFHFPAWSVHPDTTQIAGLQIGPTAVIDRFKADPNDPHLVIPRDAATLYSNLRREGARGIVLLDWERIMLDPLPAEQWTLINNGANFQPLPQSEISRFAARGAAMYKRGGWLIIGNDYVPRWLPAISRAYVVTKRRSLGGYTAYLMMPR